VLLLIGLVGLVVSQHRGAQKGVKQSDRQRYHDKMFKVVKVVDGDTFDLDIADVTTGKSFTRIRLWGVDTPETKHPRKPVMYYGPEASKFVTETVLNQKVKVILEPFERTRGKYGRLLVYIYPEDGKMLNEELLEQGYAYADYRFDHILKKQFLDLQKQAQRKKIGLWELVTPEQWPDWYRRGQESK